MNVKNNFQTEIEDQELNLLTLPLKSIYKTIVFTGTADGTPLTLAGNILDLQNKVFVLKSFRIYPYAPDNDDTGVVDFYLTDGVSTNKETIFDNGRLTRGIDLFGGGFSIDFRINGQQIGIFSANQAAGAYPLDLWLDNIFYKYGNEKLQEISLSIQGLIVLDISVTPYTAPNLINPDVKVVIECYLIQ